MSNDLEEQLRSALRPVDPGEEFSQRVLARIAADEKSAPRRTADAVVISHPRFGRARLQWLSAALAASLLVAVVGTHFWRQQDERAAGLEARQQLIEALRLTSDKLDLAYDGVHSQSQPLEENVGA